MPRLFRSSPAHSVGHWTNHLAQPLGVRGHVTHGIACSNPNPTCIHPSLMHVAAPATRWAQAAGMPRKNKVKPCTRSGSSPLPAQSSACAAVPVPSPVTAGRRGCALTRRSELGVRLLIVLVLVAGARPRQRLGRVVALLVLALGRRQLLLRGAARSATAPSAPYPYTNPYTLCPIPPLGGRINCLHSTLTASAPSAPTARAPGSPRGLQESCHRGADASFPAERACPGMHC